MIQHLSYPVSNKTYHITWQTIVSLTVLLPFSTQRLLIYHDFSQKAIQILKKNTICIYC